MRQAPSVGWEARSPCASSCSHSPPSAQLAGHSHSHTSAQRAGFLPPPSSRRNRPALGRERCNAAWAMLSGKPCHLHTCPFSSPRVEQHAAQAPRAPRRRVPLAGATREAPPWPTDVDSLLAAASVSRSDFSKEEENLQIIYNNISQLDIPSRRLGNSTAQVSDSAQVSQQPAETGVPVYVMLPLDTVWPLERDGRKFSVIKREAALSVALRTLHKAGVEGVMVDMWWGIVEQEPGRYDFSAYQRLFQQIADSGLKVQAVMSFHAAGGNVGDTCHITLPQWVLDVGESNPDIFYTDKEGFRNRECLSLGCDEQRLFSGRTPIDMYHDFIHAFADRFQHMFGSTITEVTVGMGPAGELRYPAYPEGDGRWRFPGVGEFQCYDAYMLADLKARADSAGHPEWGLGGPHDSGTYNSRIWDTGFFQHHWDSEYGRFFLDWYSGLLQRHADTVLTAAASALHAHSRPSRMRAASQGKEGEVVFHFEPACHLGIKLAGVHWWHKSYSHAAELTAGYYNTCNRDGYTPLLQIIAKHRARASFTCVEMRDCEHPQEAQCSPQGLLQQVIGAAAAAGVPLSGENALQRYDHFAFDRIAESAFGHHARAGRLEQLTFLRMGDLMFDNWQAFQDFLHRMRTPPHHS